MGKTDLAYLAGFFDGEGSIVIDKNYALRASVVNTNKWILELFRFYFGGSISVAKPSEKSPHVCYQWHTHADNTLEFLKIITPYLKLKQLEAELGIKFQSTKQLSHYVSPYKKIPHTVRVLREADRILMQKLKGQVKGEPENRHNIETQQLKEVASDQLPWD